MSFMICMIGIIRELPQFKAAFFLGAQFVLFKYYFIFINLFIDSLIYVDLASLNSVLASN